MTSQSDAEQEDQIARLMRFYGVKCVEALVVAQADHIERLQKKLPPSKDVEPQNYRQG